jgi:hypothetical protein
VDLTLPKICKIVDLTALRLTGEVSQTASQGKRFSSRVSRIANRRGESSGKEYKNIEAQKLDGRDGRDHFKLGL